MTIELNIEQLRTTVNKLVSKFRELEKENSYILKKVEYENTDRINATETIYQCFDEIIRWDHLVEKLQDSIEKAKKSYTFSIIEKIIRKHNIFDLKLELESAENILILDTNKDSAVVPENEFDTSFLGTRGAGLEGRSYGTNDENLNVATPFNVLANKYLHTIFNSDEKYFTDTTYTSKKHLVKMLVTALKHETVWPVEKLYNWLGYVCGVLTENAIINVEEEREFSRPLYHEYYRNKGIPIPETLDLTE